MAKKSGLFLGLLAGTALGILFAPKKGKVLREKIKKEVDEGGYGLEAVKEGVIGMGKDVVETAKEAYASDEVQDMVDKGKKHAKKTYAELEDKAEELMDEGKTKAKRAYKKVGRKAKAKAKKVEKKVKSKVKKAGKKAKAFTKKKIGK